MIILKCFIILCCILENVLLTFSEFSSTTSKCKCGLDASRGRIIGGVIAEEGEYPWQVGFLDKNFFYCSGTIINNKYILTAGHCFKWLDSQTKKIVTKKSSNIVFLLGRQNLSFRKIEREKGIIIERRRPSQIIYHPQYDPKNYFSDIALVKLDRPIEKYNYYIYPICLPPPYVSYENKTVTISGWGATTVGAGAEYDLRKAKVQVLTSEKCKNKFPRHFKEKSMICAAAPGFDACQGDSGGPMVYKQFRQYIQIGIVSYGRGCGDYSTPGVYTRVNAYLPWIYNSTSDAVYCRS